MKAFLWQNVVDVSDSWHNDGSVLVVAEGLSEARALFAAYSEDRKIPRSVGEKGRPPPRRIEDAAPGRVYDVGNANAEVLVFPDAGCC